MLPVLWGESAGAEGLHAWLRHWCKEKGLAWWRETPVELQQKAGSIKKVAEHLLKG